MIKNKEWICPSCGSDENVERDDFSEYDGEMSCYFTCHECDCQWKEYFRVIYDGYYFNNVDYDKEGKRM